MADDLSRTFLGSGPAGYGVSATQGAVLTNYNYPGTGPTDPDLYANTVTDGASTWTDCLIVGNPATLVLGRVFLVFTPAGPAILGNSYQKPPTVIQDVDATNAGGGTFTRPANATRRDYAFTSGADTLTMGYWSNGNLTATDTTVTDVVFVIHGTDRDPDNYVTYAMDSATQAGLNNRTSVLVVAPHFIADTDPGVSTTPSWLYWSESGWKDGNLSQSDTYARPFRVGSYEALDSMILRAAQSFPNLVRVRVIGHSAGGQYVNRYAATSKITDSLSGAIDIRFVIANPSSYLYLDSQRPHAPGGGQPGTTTTPTFSTLTTAEVTACPGHDTYKYGLAAGLNAYAALSTVPEIRTRYQSRKVTYLAGSLDTADTNSLDTSCEGNWQGAYRLHRSANFFAYLAVFYGSAPVNHTRAVVAGVGHDGAAMITSVEARTALFGGQYLFTRPTSGPARTEVINATGGAWAATFTDGARTVALAGPQRTFTEQKPVGTDQFDRVITTGWGRSPNLGTWDDFNGSDTDYSVAGGQGRIAALTTNVGRYVRLNDVVSTYDVRMAVTTSTTPAGAANSCALLGGFTDTSNHMRYRLTFNSTGSVTAAITKVVAGTETVLAGSSTVAASGYVANQLWRVRASFDGTTHSMWAWLDGTTQPTTATLTVADTTYPTGKLGVRSLASTGATNNPVFLFDDYQVSSAVWPTPPTVTHSTWVRLLPAPFTGTVDTAWLTAALATTSPDLLAVAMEYITGGVKDAGYGPLYAPGRSWDTGHADDGTRQEGSDWNDYLGVTGNYPGLTTTTDAAEPHQLGCLDCSGYVRTVFGYRGDRGITLPMCLDDAADYNGLRIPRRSVDQSASGPGITVVFSASSAPTDLSQIQPGDVLYWDADTTNPAEEEGQVDHSGIYLGVDSTGGKRFLSSRKTANGPTLSDLGGPAVITGTSLYGRALRRARRF
jgi:hypothetical protein